MATLMVIIWHELCHSSRCGTARRDGEQRAEPFVDDQRTVAFDEADDETGATLGELVQEAIEALGGGDED